MGFAAFRFVFLSLALAAAARPLDQVRIHANYHDGEFEKVLHELEAYQKAGKPFSASDSLFLEKHLAVVYAANPDTRELGRYHMYRMLDVAPGADLLDMYVGEEVDAVFEKVRKERALRPKAAKPRLSRPAWETAALSLENAPSTGASSAWDDLGPIASVPARQPVPSQPGSAKIGATASGASAIPGPSEPSSRTGEVTGPGAKGRQSGITPAWKEPGLWLGGGAALAVVAFTIFNSTSSSTPEPKTYAVPATAAR